MVKYTFVAHRFAAGLVPLAWLSPEVGGLETMGRNDSEAGVRVHDYAVVLQHRGSSGYHLGS